MTSKTFLIKGGIVRFQLKRFWWVAGFYALLLFLVTPFRILNEDTKYLIDRITRFPETASSTLLNDAGMFVLLIAAAVLLGICMFRYMQNVRSATLLHALPVKRRELYVSSLVAGVILLAVPILLNAVILFTMSLLGDYYTVLMPHFILDWIGGQLLTGIAVFCFTFFVGVLTGSSVAQLVFTFVFCFLPVGIMSLLSYLLEDWLFGFCNNGIDQYLELLLQITPMYYPQFLCREPIWWIPVLEGVYILLFSGLGLFLYHKRDTERAGDVAAFRFMRPLFLYGVSFCVMLVGVCFVREIGNADGAPNVLVMLLFALLGYCVAKALLLKSFRIFPYYKGYIVFASILLLTYAAISFNLFGYGTTIPATDSIEKAYIGYHYTPEWNSEYDIYGNSTQYAVFAEQDSIEAVRSLQRMAIEEGKLTRKEAEANGKQGIYYSYLTKSGRLITRVYYMKADMLFDLFSTDEAKDSMYRNIRVYPERIKYIEVIHSENREVYGEKKEALLACVQKDLDRLSYEEINKHAYILQRAAGYSYGYDGEPMVEKAPAEPKTQEKEFTKSLLFNVRYEERDVNIWFDYNENFTETVNWLKENGYWE